MLHRVVSFLVTPTLGTLPYCPWKKQKQLCYAQIFSFLFSYIESLICCAGPQVSSRGIIFCVQFIPDLNMVGRGETLYRRGLGLSETNPNPNPCNRSVGLMSGGK